MKLPNQRHKTSYIQTCPPHGRCMHSVPAYFNPTGDLCLYMWTADPPASPRPLPLKSRVTRVLLNMRRSATALAPSSAPTLHQPIFRVSTCRETRSTGSERGRIIKRINHRMSSGEHSPSAQLNLKLSRRQSRFMSCAARINQPKEEAWACDNDREMPKASSSSKFLSRITSSLMRQQALASCSPACERGLSAS